MNRNGVGVLGMLLIVALGGAVGLERCAAADPSALRLEALSRQYNSDSMYIMSGPIDKLQEVLRGEELPRQFLAKNGMKNSLDVLAQFLIAHKSENCRTGLAFLQIRMVAPHRAGYMKVSDIEVTVRDLPWLVKDLANIAEFCDRVLLGVTKSVKAIRDLDQRPDVAKDWATIKSMQEDAFVPKSSLVYVLGKFYDTYSKDGPDLKNLEKKDKRHYEDIKKFMDRYEFHLDQSQQQFFPQVEKFQESIDSYKNFLRELNGLENKRQSALFNALAARSDSTFKVANMPVYGLNPDVLFQQPILVPDTKNFMKK